MSASQPNILSSRKRKTGVCSLLVLRTKTISQGLPAAKQDESCIKTDSGNSADMTTAHFLARVKLKELLHVALVTSISSLERQTSLSPATITC